MTAHRCCPECGAELTADGTKFCGCVGPFTAEHVDPMHIRPYVDLPDADGGAPEAPEVPDLEPFARCGTGETAPLPVVGAGQGAYGTDQGVHGTGEPLDEGARDYVVDYSHSAESAGEAPGAGHGADGRRRPRAGGRRRRPAGRAARRAQEPRRRRPGAAAAAAGVVAALGAGLLTAQSLTGADEGDDRSLSEQDRSAPEMPTGGPTESPGKTRESKDSDRPSATPSRTPQSPSRADRGGGDHTERESVPSSAPTTRPEEPGTSPGRDDDDGGPGSYTPPPRPPQEPSEPDEQTLRPGDTGPQVADLQRRLKQVGALEQEAPGDGVYSEDVQQAVARFQARNQVRGDRYGEYGPNTRRVLEAQTGS